MTTYTRETATAPSAFVARLRRYLKTRRVTSIAQVGTDRIIEIQYSDGQYRLFLEFYAGGNIILTDRDLSVISLLRIVNEEKEKLRVGSIYSLDDRQNFRGIPPLTSERISSGLQKALENVGENAASQKRKKSERKPGDALRKALAVTVTEFPPVLLDHALHVANLDVAIGIEQLLKDSALLEKLTAALGNAQTVMDHLFDHSVCKGFIITKPEKRPSPIQQLGEEHMVGSQPNSLYEDFQPFRPAQHNNGDGPETTIIELNSFNETVDEFFSSVESQKLESRLTEKEENAKKKLDSARSDHQSRLEGLQQVQELNVRKARAIEANVHKVQEATNAVNGLLASGMDWMDVARLIEVEQERHNVVAELIRLPLKLFENTVTLVLQEAVFHQEPDYDGDETDSEVFESSEEEASNSIESAKALLATAKTLAVDIDLALSPWSNARQYYEQKKHAANKEQKTLQSSEKALKNTERKINTDLQKGLKQEKELMRPLRQAYWFEKFVYFISSEGYLVIGAKDLQQSDILYKKHLRRGDVYVHADLQGAISVIVKNKPGMMDSPIPPSTLSQAGTLAVATSSAWESKAVMSAWWVDAEQVSKMGSTSDFLPPGCFNIQKQKNFLPPAQLLLGLGIMFQISEASKARHLKHRVQDNNSSRFGGNFEVGQIIKEAESPRKSTSDSKSQNDSEAHDAQSEEENNVQQNTSDSEGQSTEPDDGGLSDSSGDEHVNPLQPDPRSSIPPITGIETIMKTRDSDRTIPENVHSANDFIDAQDEALAEADSKTHMDENESKVTHLQGDELVAGGVEATNVEPDDGKRPVDASMLSGVAAATPLSKSVLSPHVRGKHGKRSKIKTKYAAQDDEDRELAMRLLGSSAAKNQASEEAAAKEVKEQDLLAQRERRRRQHAEAAIRGKEEEEIRKLQFERDIYNLDDEETENVADLEALVGTPLPGDEVIQILVVCAPWSAIGGRCRWSVKIQPGSTKKGKAVREILNKWNTIILDREKKKRSGSGEGNEVMIEEENLRKREGDLIRSIREPEVIGLVPVSKVRVAISAKDAGKGGKAAAGKGKRGGKGSKKSR